MYAVHASLIVTKILIILVIQTKLKKHEKETQATEEHCKENGKPGPDATTT